MKLARVALSRSEQLKLTTSFTVSSTLFYVVDGDLVGGGVVVREPSGDRSGLILGEGMGLVWRPLHPY